MKIDKLMDLKNKKIAILGYGKEGKSTLSFLNKIGINNITILDSNENIEIQEGINSILGREYLNNLGDYELIFKSPGISPYNEKLTTVLDKLITQAQIFFDNYKGKIIGITGTKGKSTTSTLAYETLSKIGYNTKLVGNIGNPVLDEVDIINGEKHDFIVYELSSYMLEGLKPKLFIGVINNIYDCHLDWHKGRPNYEKAKYSVISDSKYKLINYELKNNINNSGQGIFFFGENGNYSYKNGLFYKNEHQLFKDKNIALQGEHNRKNICVVLGILDFIDSDNFETNIQSMQDVLSSFSGLPHRIQNIGVYNGITFVDDAIATTPESTIAAIKTFDHNIGTILLGGENTGLDFEDLKNTLKKYNIKNIVLFPDTTEKILGDLSNYKYEQEFKLVGEYSPNILKTKYMKSAIEFAYKNTEKGKICILSNAAPSFSIWSGYIQKGLSFQDEVKKQK